MERETDGQAEALCRQLATTDSALGFLLLLIASVLLSFLSVTLQRKGLCLAIQGREPEAERLPPVYPIKRTAAAMVIGSLGFFLCLALGAAGEAAQGQDPVARRSAGVNLWASVLVLAAAILRLDDLDFVERSRQTALLEESDLPA